MLNFILWSNEYGNIFNEDGTQVQHILGAYERSQKWHVFKEIHLDCDTSVAVDDKLTCGSV